ncbi:hypothetical protein [Halostagnicola kamekurae]|nr:hypothetical protein [Halostagnicola kamekurae]
MSGRTTSERTTGECENPRIRPKRPTEAGRRAITATRATTVIR